MKRALANNSVARSGNRGIRHRWNYPSYLYNRSLESLTGQHAREDAQRSFILNSQAAESGMKDAVLAMGWFYLNGVGIEQDIEQARRWYRKSVQVDAVDVQIVSVLHLGTVQFATTHEKVNQAIEVWKLRLMHGGN